MKFTGTSPLDTAEHLRGELTSLKTGKRRVYADTRNAQIRDISREHIALLEQVLTTFERKAIESSMRLP